MARLLTKQESLQQHVARMRAAGFELPWECKICAALGQPSTNQWSMSWCLTCKQPNHAFHSVMEEMHFEEDVPNIHPLFALARKRGPVQFEACLALAGAEMQEEEGNLFAQDMYKRAHALWRDLDSDMDGDGVPRNLRGEVDALLEARGLLTKVPNLERSLPGGVEGTIPVVSTRPNLLQPRIWHRLEPCERILLAGCGGGFDVFQAIPLYFTLRAMGKTVHIANLTFSEPDRMRNIVSPLPGLYEITANTLFPGDYCPEAYLARYLRERHGIDTVIHTIARAGYAVVKSAYQHLTVNKNLDAIVVVDGGSDSLMAGDEDQLATIEEDHISIMAANDVVSDDLKLRCLVVLGLGVDRFHGCSDAASLRAVAELTAVGGFFGMQMLEQEMLPVQYYKELVEYANASCRSSPSIVGASIVSALEGHYGNYHSNPRTHGSALYINPMMSMLWFFDVAAVKNRWRPGLYEALRGTATRAEVGAAVGKFRRKLGLQGGIRQTEEFPRTHDHTTEVAAGS